MKAPDKIYVPQHSIEAGDIQELNEPIVAGSTEYVRKEALLEWLEQNRNQAQMWFDRYNDREDLSAKQVWEEVIGKLNEM